MEKKENKSKSIKAKSTTIKSSTTKSTKNPTNKKITQEVKNKQELNTNLESTNVATKNKVDEGKDIKSKKETIKSSKDDFTLQSQEERIKKNTPKSNKRKKIAVATTATVLIATAIAVPTVLYLSRRKFDVNVLTNTDIVEEYTINVKRGVYIRNLTAQQIEGYTFVGFYKDAQLMQPYGENDRVRGDMQIYAKYEINIYSLKFPTSPAFTIEGEAIEGNQVNIEYNTEYQFKINLNAGYTESEITVKANGEIIKADSNDYYTLTVKDDIVIEVEGVAINTYTITFYDETGETIYKIEEVEYNQDSTYKEIPTKHSTPTYNYTFAGWVDSEGNPVDLTNIIVDKDVYASFTEEYIEYRINKIPSQVVIKNSEGIELTGSNTLHYGDIVEITYKASPGYVTNSFSVSGAKRIGETNMYQVIDNILIEYSEEKAINLDFEIRNGVLISYLGTETEIEIPATYSLDESGNVVEGIDYQVVSIGPRAFEGQTNLTSVVLPDSIVMIGDYAFSDCTNLINMNIPNKIIDIGTGSFSGCESLTSITLPESLVSIGDSAFKDCTGLIEINYNAISVLDLTPSILGNNIFDNAGRDASGIVVNIGASVERIPAYLFNPYASNSWSSTRPKILSIKFDENSKCIEIGDCAFRALDELTEINLPNSLISIGEDLFRLNNNLEYNVKDGLKYLGNDINPFLLLMGMEDTTLTDVIIDENCRFLYSDIFGRDNIITVSIPKSVEYIGTDAFRMCSKLTDVYYEGMIDEWVAISFSDSTANPLNKGANLYVNGDELVTEINIDTATTINAYVFYGCISLTKVTIGSQVTSIGEYAFYGCTGLTSITIPESVTSIGSSAFRNCTELTSITMQESVTSIGSSAFYGCTGLTSITIPGSVTSIGSSAFYRCDNLANVYYEGTIEEWIDISFGGSSANPLSNGANLFVNDDKLVTEVNFDSATTIKTGVFQGCKSLTKVTIGSQVTSIGSYAFSDCEGLTSITIPDSVTSIGSYAFSGCNLTSVTIESNYAYKNAGTGYNQCGYLLQDATVVRVLTSCIGESSNSYLENSANFTKTIDGEYTVYTKVS